MWWSILVFKIGDLSVVLSEWPNNWDFIYNGSTNKFFCLPQWSGQVLYPHSIVCKSAKGRDKSIQMRSGHVEFAKYPESHSTCICKQLFKLCLFFIYCTADQIPIEFLPIVLQWTFFINTEVTEIFLKHISKYDVCVVNVVLWFMSNRSWCLRPGHSAVPLWSILDAEPHHKAPWQWWL